MKLIKSLLFTLPCLAFSLVANAADAGKAENCLHLSRIDNVRILDSQRILFEVNSNKAYLNTLPHSCPGMKKNDTLMYRTSLSKLCNLDTVTVLEHIGGGYMPGVSCGLGKFSPVDKEEVKMLKESVKKAQ